MARRTLAANPSPQLAPPGLISVGRLEIALRWEFRSRLLQAAIDRVLPATARSMVEAFERRAASVQPEGSGSYR